MYGYWVLSLSSKPPSLTSKDIVAICIFDNFRDIKAWNKLFNKLLCSRLFYTRFT